MSKDKARNLILIMGIGYFLAANILHDLNNLFIRKTYFNDRIEGLKTTESFSFGPILVSWFCFTASKSIFDR